MIIKQQQQFTISPIFCGQRFMRIQRQWWWFSYSVVSTSLQPHGLQPARLLWPWDCLGKNTWEDFPFLLQGIFLTQGSNLCVLLGGFFTTEPPGKPPERTYLGVSDLGPLEQLAIRWASFSPSCFSDFSVTFPHWLDWASLQHGGLKGSWTSHLWLRILRSCPKRTKWKLHDHLLNSLENPH